MAFEVSKTAYHQIDPSLAYGYPYESRYHNVGQLQTPYQGKLPGQLGDYGVPQATKYYNPWNPVYPYVMDANFRPVGYLPTEGCIPGFQCPGYFPAYESQYPDVFVAPDYFSPEVRVIKGYTQPTPRPPTTITRSAVGPTFASTGACENKEGFDYVKLRNSYRGIAGSKNFVH